MNAEIRQDLVSRAKKFVKGNDASHDVHHALRVLIIAEHIAEHEQADLDIMLAEKQKLYLKTMFENGFTLPN